MLCRWCSTSVPSSGCSRCFVPSCAVEHLVARPQLAEGRADLEQLADQRGERRVVVAARVLRAEARERVAGGRLAGRPAVARVREHPPQEVPGAVVSPAWACRSGASQRGSRPGCRCADPAGRRGWAPAPRRWRRAPPAPPSDTRPPRSARRRRRGRRGARARADRGRAPARARRARCGRRRDVAALLEPRVPGQPHPGELGDLLAPQARRAPRPPASRPTESGVVRSRCAGAGTRRAPRGGWVVVRVPGSFPFLCGRRR